MSKKYAVIGKHISHSLSPDLHHVFARYTSGYSYGRFDLEEDQLEELICHSDYTGFNVTSPYKRVVIQYLDRISDEAKELNAVNTIKRLPDGTLEGYNTDVYGFERMIEESRISGRKVLVLGSGGACSAICKALQNMHAGEIWVVSRHGKEEAGFCTYNDLSKHLDAQIIVNATPVGMYPDSEKSPMDGAPVTLRDFSRLEGVFDAIYNPYRTKLLRDAEDAGIFVRSGLSMLVYQGLRSAQIWREVPKDGMGRKKFRLKERDRNDRSGKHKGHRNDNSKKRRTSGNGHHKTVAVDLGREAMKRILPQQMNVVLIGMPGSGKSCVGRQLSLCMKRPFVDVDRKFTEIHGMTPSDMIKEKGEAYFRNLETEVLRDVCKEKGLVIATGGGAVVREENYGIMRENGVVVYMKRPLYLLSRKNRPLSVGVGVEELYRQRAKKYETAAHLIVENRQNFGYRKGQPSNYPPSASGTKTAEAKSRLSAFPEKSRGRNGKGKKNRHRQNQNFYMEDIRRFARTLRNQIVRYMDENLDY